MDFVLLYRTGKWVFGVKSGVFNPRQFPSSVLVYPPPYLHFCPVPSEAEQEADGGGGDELEVGVHGVKFSVCCMALKIS